MIAAKLYNIFQKQSFKRHFGIELNDLTELEKYSNINDYLDKIKVYNTSKFRIEQTEYEMKFAPQEKLSILISFLNANKTKPKTIIDFGSGNNSCLELINQYFDFQHSVGIETDNRYSNSNNETSIIYNSLENVSDKKFDLIMMIHTLHHIKQTQHNKVILDMKKSMHKNSIFYLFEDSWNEEVNQDFESKSLDFEFSNLCTSEKIEFLRINEYWSNKWFYNRSFDIENTHYYSYEQLLLLITELGFKIIKSGFSGINTKRIHGVPSAWVIAKPIFK